MNNKGFSFFKLILAVIVVSVIAAVCFPQYIPIEVKNVFRKLKPDKPLYDPKQVQRQAARRGNPNYLEYDAKGVSERQSEGGQSRLTRLSRKQ